VTKPAKRGRGINVTLVRTRDLEARWAELTFNGAQRTLAQQYIEHSEDGLPTGHRVMTMCGKAIYSTRVQWGERRRSLEEIAASDGVIATNSDAATAPTGRLRVPWIEDEIIRLAEQASAAFPECPVLGLDIRLVECGTYPLGLRRSITPPITCALYMSNLMH
jgi:glutathione synthase/RimK-type ligase-like ATP-grasp enzyme